MIQRLGLTETLHHIIGFIDLNKVHLLIGHRLDPRTFCTDTQYGQKSVDTWLSQTYLITNHCHAVGSTQRRSWRGRTSCRELWPQLYMGWTGSHLISLLLFSWMFTSAYRCDGQVSINSCIIHLSKTTDTLLTFKSVKKTHSHTPDADTLDADSKSPTPCQRPSGESEDSASASGWRMETRHAHIHKNSVITQETC